MGFHATQQRALHALETLRKEQPDLADRTRGFEDHYLNGGLEKPSAHMLHAAVCLLVSQDFGHATRLLSQKGQHTFMQAERHIIDAVNFGPASLQDDEGFLHDKGVMRGSKKYFLGFKGIEKGGLYDIAWRTMDPAYRPIIAAAVQGSMNQKDRVISRKVLQYVSACLMPEDDAKYLQLNKLSIKYERENTQFLKEAAKFIRHTARELNITLPESMLEGVLTSKTLLAESTGAKAEPITPTRLEKPAAETPLRKEFQHRPTLAPVAAPRPPANDTPQAESREPTVTEAMLLKRKLDRLEKLGEISPKSAKGYFWLHSGPQDEERTCAQLADKIGKSERHVMIMMVGVKVKLKALEGEEPTPDTKSNGNRHQARAIRPE